MKQFEALLKYAHTHPNGKYTLYGSNDQSVEAVYITDYDGLGIYENRYEEYQCIIFQRLSDNSLFEIHCHHIPVKVTCDGIEIYSKDSIFLKEPVEMSLKIGIIQYFGHSFNNTRDVGMLWDISHFHYQVITENSFLETSYLYYLVNVVNKDDFCYCPTLPVNWIVFEDNGTGPVNIREFSETEDVDIFHILMTDDFWTTWLPDFPKDDKDDCLKLEMYRWINSLPTDISTRYSQKYGKDENVDMLLSKASCATNVLIKKGLAPKTWKSYKIS